ncbi:alpha/beta hydrolase family protein [Erythrobacter mangrovi]|nr:S9 family peptidase [Erythrobacter mangrovi]
MFRIRAAGMAAAVALAAFTQPLIATPPIEAYGELPVIEQMALSPQGGLFAAITTLNGQRVVAVFDTRLTLIKRVTIGDVKVRSVEFATEDLLLLRHSMTQELDAGFAQDKVELVQSLVIPLSATEPAVIFKDRADVLNATFGYYGTRIVDGQPKAYFGGIKLKSGSFDGGYYFDHGRPGLYEVDLRTNRSKLVDSPAPEGFYRRWIVGPDGSVLALIDVRDANGEWVVRNGADTIIARGESHNGAAGLVATGPGGRTVIYRVQGEADEAPRWIEIALDGSGSESEFLPGVGIERLYKDSLTGQLIGYRPLGEDPHFFQSTSTSRARAVRKAFAGLNPSMLDWTSGLGRVLVNTHGNEDSGSFFIVDLAAMRADSVGLERPQIEPGDVGPISTVTYQASDGLEIEGILTLPPGREARQLPLVVLPHGGPHARDIAGFDWWAQAFASRGYAVFQPNFRGSTGRGVDFERAGYGEWGKKMQTDISDGVAKLAADGTIDPTRACIVGASYGGYAALAGVTLQNGLYRCAVSVAGVADLSLMSRIERRESGDSRIFTRSLEEELGPKSGLRAVSPRFNAAQADAPVLLIHGRDDTVVPYLQSEKMADALKDAGKPYELLELKGEDHWLSLGSTRLQMLKAAVSFVEKHNPPD